MTQPASVLFLIKHMDIGGGEYVFRTIIERLDRARFRPVLACLTIEGRFGRELREAGIPVYAQLLRFKADGTVLLRLAQIVRREKIRAIYLMDYRDAMLWGALIGRLMNVPTLIATHSTDWWGPLRSPTLVGKKLINWHAKVIAIADFQRQHMAAREQIDHRLIEVVPNGIDVSRYKVCDKGARPSIEGVPDGAILIGTVAVLRTEKNIDMLFVAVRQLLDVGTNLHVAIVGDGDQRPRLEALTRTMGLDQAVHFLGYRDNPAPYISAFDVFTLTSTIEVMPITILEAMACAIPVVATDVGAVGEIVVDGETGFVVPSRDVEALVSRLSQLIGDKALRDRMGARGRVRVEALFTIDRMVKRTGDMIGEAVMQATGGA